MQDYILLGISEISPAYQQVGEQLVIGMEERTQSGFPTIEQISHLAATTASSPFPFGIELEEPGAVHPAGNNHLLWQVWPRALLEFRAALTSLHYWAASIRSHTSSGTSLIRWPILRVSRPHSLATPMDATKRRLLLLT